MTRERYKPYLIFGAIISFGLIVLFLISLGYYPIALVNTGFISAREFLRNYETASLYYQNLLKTYPANSGNDKILKPKNIQLLVLTQLIENRLIDQEARDEAGSDLTRIIDEKISQINQGAQFQAAVETLYGLQLDEFRKEILVPQAEKDIVAGRLFLKGQKIDGWLAGAKKSSRVIIFSNKFYWNGNNVEMR